MIKRLFDLFFSFIGLVILSPLFILLILWIVLDSKGSPFFLQTRVGKNVKDFKIFKFRTMHVNSESKGLLTVGKKDARVTRAGFFLRKYKLDELPQLINVFAGTMSFVGPRPEVRKYVELYTEEQLKVLSVKPGITDLASIEYLNENELLGKSIDPEKTYISEIMPDKLKINLEYIENKSFFKDLSLIVKTVIRIIRNGQLREK